MNVKAKLFHFLLRRHLCVQKRCIIHSIIHPFNHTWNNILSSERHFSYSPFYLSAQRTLMCSKYSLFIQLFIHTWNRWLSSDLNVSLLVQLSPSVFVLTVRPLRLVLMKKPSWTAAKNWFVPKHHNSASAEQICRLRNLQYPTELCFRKQPTSFLV